MTRTAYNPEYNAYNLECVKIDKLKGKEYECARHRAYNTYMKALGKKERL